MAILEKGCSECPYPIDEVALPSHPSHDLTRLQIAATYPKGHPHRVFLEAIESMPEPAFDVPRQMSRSGWGRKGRGRR